MDSNFLLISIFYTNVKAKVITFFNNLVGFANGYFNQCNLLLRRNFKEWRDFMDQDIRNSRP